MLTRPFLDKFERMPMSPAQLRTYCGDKTLVKDASLNTSLHKGYTNKHFIQHNGDWLCMVCVKQKTAYVYTIKNRANLAIEDDQYENEGLYTHRLLTCPCTRMFDADDTSDQYESGYEPGYKCADEFDNCGVCGGDGSTCLAVNDMIKTNKFSLSSIYPNPFNPTTKIDFSIPIYELVTINAYDIKGRAIETLINKKLQPDTYSINWHASAHPSGIYLIKMKSGNYSHTQKVILIK